MDEKASEPAESIDGLQMVAILRWSSNKSDKNNPISSSLAVIFFLMNDWASEGSQWVLQ
jgi:hypothetical protein